MPNPIQSTISEDVARASRDLVEQILAAMSGRAFSPRIKLLDIEQVSEATRMGASTIYRMIEGGTFPKPQKNLGKNLWRESSIIAWCDANDPNLGA